jgi:RNA polymerase sigma-70 factor (ECF subfamily)
MKQEQRGIAFEILYAEHAAPLYRFALRLCGNREDAEDLAAEALAQAFRNGTEFKGGSSPRTWLCAIVVNQWKMRMRKGQVRKAGLERANEVAETYRFENLEIAEAIQRLSNPLREAFLLVKGEGFTHAEAAKVLRVPVGTVYSRVHDAVISLRRDLSTDAALEKDDKVQSK